ncbi:MAG: hypothetical protein WBC93_17850 [Sulfitobacter sp.]
MVRMVCLIAAFILMTANAGRAEIAALTGDIWSVCGWDGSATWNDTLLVFTNQIPGNDVVHLEGYFDWRSNHGYAGREHFSGTITSDGTLKLQGFRLQGNQNITTSRYHAKLAASGTALLEGVWLDGVPGIWGAVRDGGHGSASALCNR